MILDIIVESKKIQIKRLSDRNPIEQLKKNIKSSGDLPLRDFAASIKQENVVKIIAEVKKASPSKGIICENFDYLQFAQSYQINGAAAISVLTETEFFKGRDDYLTEIKGKTTLPILRKDFIIDAWQIFQSRLIGADAILLIAAILDQDRLKKFRIIAEVLGMQCLVEIHDEKQAVSALESGAKIIGINNRNLNTFETDLKTTQRLISMIPDNIIKVSESGIKNRHDIEYLKRLGVNAVLIGETLMREVDPGEKLRSLV